MNVTELDKGGTPIWLGVQNVETNNVEGVTVCADCQVPLVDELPEETPFDDKVLLGTLDSAEEALKVAKFLNFKGINSAFAVADQNETEFPVYVDEVEKGRCQDGS